MPDHPRIRGEHSPTHMLAFRQAGSSPHTRGAPQEVRADIPQRRIIPAYAGSTVVDRGGDPRVEDHPRIRGEHSCSLYPWVAQGRIIPAYAGSTSSNAHRTVKGRDHPRIRGEHAPQETGDPGWNGSSPHTRGARVAGVPQVGSSRIIPAYAGSTPASAPAIADRRDHPRIRGEHYR
ncbi:hypothetical protein HMPREF0043_00187 [Actinobaculum sp. oral taxon 183 str. F0552]|nr:hypothetical protein HMPREF0043_00187 [Actinobaculum sp. oral taxon 183 str. F0552]